MKPAENRHFFVLSRIPLTQIKKLLNKGTWDNLSHIMCRHDKGYGELLLVRKLGLCSALMIKKIIKSK